MGFTEHSVLLEAPEDFNFWLTIRGSGWSVLKPFSFNEERQALSRVHRLSSGETARATVKEKRKGELEILVESHEGLEKSGLEEIEQAVAACLRLDEDQSSLLDLLRGYPEFGWVEEIGAGRSVRSPTVFEDVVKTICTTNASCGLTKGIVSRLYSKLGEVFAGDAYTFPTPERMASAKAEFIKKEIKAGYRSPYIAELARKVVDGELDVEAWNNSSLVSSSLKREILKVKGVGEYAADNILKLLGRYDFLALDSWMRRRFSETHGGGGEVSDEEIREFYAPFGRWKGLVFSLDMAKDYLVPRSR
ncbi:MAG: hypothetical protein JSV18_06805 [Candidatus Bathyarchaeota archaeon]|nr:MAG: hypothetical protein JSV18_06805 [Candidatus Bathyarchaeota archaeon]